MEKSCSIDGHQNNKITRICIESQCERKRILCSECYIQDHNQHTVLKLEEFFDEVQQLKQKNCFDLLDIITKKSQKIKSFKEQLETILKNYELEFQEHQKYLQTSLDEISCYDFQSVTEDFIDLFLEIKENNILEQNYHKLMQLVFEQEKMLNQTLEQFQSQSSSIVLNQILTQNIQSQELIQFYKHKLKLNDEIPKKFSLIRGQELRKQILKTENSIYYGEVNGTSKQGRGLYIVLKEQIIIEGIWINNNLRWGKRIEQINANIKGTIGYFDEDLKNCGDCVVQFDNQDYYQGELVGGLFQGYGEFKFNNNKYQGNFYQDQFHGNGQLFYSNLESYKGNFQQGKKHEQGEFQFQDGRKYIGEFYHDIIQGQGEFRDQNNEIISQGNYVNGKSHGQGKLYLSAEKIFQKIKSLLISSTSENQLQGSYEGNFVYDKFEGLGILEIPNIFKYEGQFKNEQFHGLGILHIQQTKEIYKGKFYESNFIYGYYECLNYQYFGSFFCNMMDGKGIFYNLKDQSSYVGQFIKNQKSGRGQLDLSDKTYYKGQFNEDQLQGEVITVFASKNRFNGIYRNGREIKGTMLYADGSRYEGEFFGQKKEGQGILYLQNGDKIKGQFKDDQIIEGEYQFANLDIFQGNFENGQIKNGIMRYNNGNEFEGILINLQKQDFGKYKYYENGFLFKYKGHFLNDLKHGLNGILEIYQIIDQVENLIQSFKGEFQEDKLVGKAEVQIIGVLKYQGTMENLQISGKGIIQYCNGVKYEGDVKEAKMHGFGTLEYCGVQGKSKYIGQFVDDKEEGDGVLLYMNGDKYEGKFVNGLKNGSGTFTKSDTIYVGEFINDLREGKGILYRMNEKIYEGNWEADRYHGLGKSFDQKSKESFEGSFYQGKLQGFGRITVNNILIYEGEFEQGKKQGKGKIYFLDGDLEYEGDFREDYKWGYGKLVQKDKKEILMSYEGDFVEDQKDGYGIEKYKSGQSYKGGFSNNQRSGMGIYTFANHDFYEGQFKDGQMNDPKGIWYYSNGEKSIGEYVDDQRQGEHQYFKNGEDTPYITKKFQNDQEKCIIF